MTFSSRHFQRKELYVLFVRVTIPLLCFLGQLKGCSPGFLGGLGKVVPNFCILVGLGWVRYRARCARVVLLKCREKERETREQPSELGHDGERIRFGNRTQRRPDQSFCLCLLLL